MNTVKPTQLEQEHIRDTLVRFSSDVEQRHAGMHYFCGLTRDGLESIRGFMPGFVEETEWNDAPALPDLLTALDEVVSSFGGSYTLHGYAKFGFQDRITIEGFEYLGTERGVGALVYKYRKADEITLDEGMPGSSVYVWWD